MEHNKKLKLNFKEKSSTGTATGIPVSINYFCHTIYSIVHNKIYHYIDKIISVSKLRSISTQLNLFNKCYTVHRHY